mmetsp:Transcript_152673/g.266068  ORF Transcript_152673/g.266068 Transcript_152673/m.266068 type:complete len:112 (-) Transcript_152673:46-381(-)
MRPSPKPVGILLVILDRGLLLLLAAGVVLQFPGRRMASGSTLLARALVLLLVLPLQNSCCGPAHTRWPDWQTAKASDLSGFRYKLFQRPKLPHNFGRPLICNAEVPLVRRT